MNMQPKLTRRSAAAIIAAAPFAGLATSHARDVRKRRRLPFRLHLECNWNDFARVYGFANADEVFGNPPGTITIESISTIKEHELLGHPIGIYTIEFASVWYFGDEVASPNMPRANFMDLINRCIEYRRTDGTT